MYVTECTTQVLSCYIVGFKSTAAGVGGAIWVFTGVVRFVLHYRRTRCESKYVIEIIRHVFKKISVFNIHSYVIFFSSTQSVSNDSSVLVSVTFSRADAIQAFAISGIEINFLQLRFEPCTWEREESPQVGNVMNTHRPLVTITRTYFIAGVAKMFVRTVFVDFTSPAAGTGISATVRTLEFMLLLLWRVSAVIRTVAFALFWCLCTSISRYMSNRSVVVLNPSCHPVIGSIDL